MLSAFVKAMRQQAFNRTRCSHLKLPILEWPRLPINSLALIVVRRMKRANDSHLNIKVNVFILGDVVEYEIREEERMELAYQEEMKMVKFNCVDTYCAFCCTSNILKKLVDGNGWSRYNRIVTFWLVVTPVF